MNLKNPFSQKTRHLYLYEYGCWICGRSDKGLELHHIFGRVSSSPYNGALLCIECHGHMGHDDIEQDTLLKLACEFLARMNYVADLRDKRFLSTTDFVNLWKRNLNVSALRDKIYSNGKET